MTYGHSPDFVRKLVELGASVTRVSGSGSTPLHSAAGSLRFGGRNCEIVELLLDRGAQVNAQAKNGWTALMGAANHGSVDVVRTLLSRGADPSLRTSAGRMWGTSDAEEIARDLEYEIVSSAPDGEQLADDYEELGGGRCAVM